MASVEVCLQLILDDFWEEKGKNNKVQGVINISLGDRGCPDQGTYFKKISICTFKDIFSV